MAFSLLIRVAFAILFISTPFQAEAGFFSLILGDDTYAETIFPDEQTATINSIELSQASGTMALLQANTSSVLISQDQNDKKKKGKKDEDIDADANVNIISDNALLPATGPLGLQDEQEAIDLSSDTSVYVVRKGDSISQIAEMFEVSVNTILSANDMKKRDKLAVGDVLFILPISGIEHTVAKGQTLKSIAKLYKADIEDITFYNGIAQDAKLAVGDKIVIPGADNMADEGGDKPVANLNSALARDKNYYETHPIQNLFGYFLNPVPTGRKTQGLHGPGNRGIDIGAVTGAPIYASASGTVAIVKSGCKLGQRRCGGGYGNMAIIEHPNGTKTLYAHMSKLGTKTGAQVAQGEIIGYVGSTGRSTGPHIHFEVFGARNPGADWSWAN